MATFGTNWSDRLWPLLELEEWLRVPGQRVTLDSPVSSKLPSIAILAFLIPISLQALLLHPIFPPSLSRPLRLLLLPFGLYYSVHSSFDHGFRPREVSVGVNFVVGVMGAYALMKTLEWAFVTDLTPYTWVGFDNQGYTRQSPQVGSKKQNGSSNGNINGKDDGSKRDRAIEHKRQLEALRQQTAENDSPVDIILWTVHLLLSMRGNGWAFGPPPRSQASPYPTDLRAYFRRAALDVAWSHIVTVTCAAVILTPHTTRSVFLARHFPSLSAATIDSFAFSCAGLSLGIAALAGLTLGMQCASLLVFTMTGLLRVLPLPSFLRPPPFDPRQYPPLFQLRAPTSVALFWSESWHFFFARSFKVLGYQPTMALLQPIGGKALGQAGAVLAVFAISAWLHEHALWSAIHTFSSFLPPGIPAITRWGSSIYFLSQGVAVVLEGLFTSLTKRKIGGFFGGVWSLAIIAGIGPLLARCWLDMGLAQELPEPKHWSWQRFVIPLAALFPPFVYTS